MMKVKRLSAILCTVILSTLLLNGCGQDDKKKEVEKSASTVAKEMDESKNSFSTDNFVEEDVMSESSAEETPEEVTLSPAEELMQYEAKDEVRNSKIEDGLIQIGDVVILPYDTMGNIMENFEKSELDWETDYNPEQLVASEDFVSVNVKYKKMQVCTFHAYNYSSEKTSIAAKDCFSFLPCIKDSTYSECQDCFIYANGYRGNGLNVENYSTYSNKYKDYTEYREKNLGNGEQLSTFFFASYSKQIEGKITNIPCSAIFDSNNGTCVSFYYNY